MTTEKEMTPMKRLSSGINEFRNHVKFYFKEITLNKSAPKYNPYSWRDGDKAYTSGVENDFIMVFNCKGVEPSFAIAFTYIGLPVEQQKVEITIKKGKDNKSIVSGGEISLEEFKGKLKAINKEFEEKSYLKNRDETTILEKISEVFLSQVYDIKAEIKQATKEINKVREEKRKEYNIENLESLVVSTTNTYDSAEKKAKKVINSSVEKTEVDNLEALLFAAKARLKTKITQVETKYDLKNLNDQKQQAKKLLIESSEMMNHEVQQKIEKYPGIVGKRLKM